MEDTALTSISSPVPNFIGKTGNWVLKGINPNSDGKTQDVAVTGGEIILIATLKEPEVKTKQKPQC